MIWSNKTFQGVSESAYSLALNSSVQRVNIYCWVLAGVISCLLQVLAVQVPRFLLESNLISSHPGMLCQGIIIVQAGIVPKDQNIHPTWVKKGPYHSAFMSPAGF